MPDPALDEIRAYYDAGIEADRLRHGLGCIEYARTQELLLRCLPPPPALIYDIGGGAGAYAFWLAGLGYQVHLFDLSPVNVAQARADCAGQPHAPAALEVADARCLPRPSASADAALLMGPLYHLPEAEERLRALREAWRVLKPGGRLAAAGITRFATTQYGLSSYGEHNTFLEDPAFLNMIFRELEDGQHIRPPGSASFIARAFFHLPEALHAELTQAGFCQVEVLPVEGLGGMLPRQRIDQAWASDTAREAILRVLRITERQPSLLGVSPHLLALAVK